MSNKLPVLGNLEPDEKGRLRRKSPKPNKLKTPWTAEKPSRFGIVRILDASRAEVTSCQQEQAEAIVRAVNWCSSRGYIK